jgi:hypothetical protein
MHKKDLESDDKTIIQILTSHTNFQRQKISSAYQGMYNRYLVSDIEGEIGGYVLDALLALLQPAQVYSARILHKAMSSRTSNRSIAVEIALTNSVSVRDQNKYAIFLFLAAKSDP